MPEISGNKFVAGSELKCENPDYNEYCTEIWQFANTLEGSGVSRPHMQIYSESHLHLPEVTHQRRVVKEAVSHSGEEGEEGVSETHLWTAQVCESIHKGKHCYGLDWHDNREHTLNLLFWSRRSSGE